MGGWCIVTTIVALTTKDMTTGEEGCFYCCHFRLFFCFDLWGGHGPHNDSSSTSSRYIFLNDFLCFLVLSGGSLPLGWWSSPCRILSPLGSWFWAVGLVFFCRLLHLASFSCTLGNLVDRPATPPPPPALTLARSAPPISCWELSVGRAEVKVRGGGDRGVINPHTGLGL